jgi:hypothetical protein
MTAEWLAKAQDVPQTQIDIGFIADADFYYGPPDNITSQQWDTLREPLYKPRLPFFGDFYVLARDIDGREDELMRYYQSVLDAAKKNNVTDVSTYFWLRPLIFKKESFAVTCPWYDTLEDSLEFLDALEAGSYDDEDQGWALEAVSDCAHFYFRESDPDTHRDRVIVRTEKDLFLRETAAARARLEKTVGVLTRLAGKNWWRRA